MHSKKHTIVFAHGWGANKHFLECLRPYLSKQFSLYFLDLWGFIPNTPHTKSIPACFDSVSEKIALYLSKKFSSFSWVGWSLGSLLGQNIALQFPNLLHSLIGIASTPYFLETQYWPGIPKQQIEYLEEKLLHSAKKTCLSFTGLHYQYPDQHLNEIKILRKKLTLHFPPHAALHQALLWIKHIDLRAQIQYIHCPFYAILGNKDPLIPVEIAPKLTALHPALKIKIIENAAHTPFLTHTKLTCQYLTQWLSPLLYAQ